MTKAFYLSLPDFNKVFEVEYDASHTNIKAVLSYEGKPIAFLVRNLVKLGRSIPRMTKNSTLFIGLFITGVNILFKPFVLFFDYEALQFINHQHKFIRDMLLG